VLDPVVHGMMLNVLIEIYNTMLGYVKRVLTSDVLGAVAYPAIEWTTEDDDLDFSMIGSREGVPGIEWNSTGEFERIRGMIDVVTMPVIDVGVRRRRGKGVRDVQEIYTGYYQGRLLGMTGSSLAGFKGVSERVWKIVEGWGCEGVFPLEKVAGSLFGIPLACLEGVVKGCWYSSFDAELEECKRDVYARVAAFEKEVGSDPPGKKKRVMEEKVAEGKVKKRRSGVQIKEDLRELMREARVNSGVAKEVFSSLEARTL
jgi:hypothetical protein